MLPWRVDAGPPSRGAGAETPASAVRLRFYLRADGHQELFHTVSEGWTEAGEWNDKKCSCVMCSVRISLPGRRPGCFRERGPDVNVVTDTVGRCPAKADPALATPAPSSAPMPARVHPPRPPLGEGDGLGRGRVRRRDRAKHCPEGFGRMRLFSGVATIPSLRFCVRGRQENSRPDG